MTNTIKPIIGRIGGKWRISSWIIKHHIERFDWSLYCEPFCGSAAIYFQLLNKGIPEKIKARGHHPRFVLNDMDSRVINLYRCCRDFPELLAYAIYFTPYSREEHRNAQKGESIDDLIEICDRFLVDGWQSISQQAGNGWGKAKYDNFDEFKEPIGSFKYIPNRCLADSQHLGQQFNELKQGIELIEDESIREQSKQALNAILSEVEKTLETDLRVEFARKFLVSNQMTPSNAKSGWSFDTCSMSRLVGYEKKDRFNNLPENLVQDIKSLKEVYLENDDFEKVCRRWDTPHSLHYLDPPYFGKEDYYSEKFTKNDHLRLCQMVHELEGQVILSYYPHTEILKMYSEDDWEFHYKTVTKSSAGITRNSKTKTRPKGTELLLVRKQKNKDKVLVDLSGQLSLF